MSHSHDHHHHENKNIQVAFFLNLGFTIIELIGGILTNSMAILSDAVHDLGDSLSLGLAWYFQSISHKRSDEKYSFGYRRFSLLGAVVNSIILVIGGVLILESAIPRLWSPTEPNTQGMILLAVLGVIVNGAAVFKLRKGKSMNEKVVSLHLLEDVLGWVAVLIGAIVMNFWEIPILDPLLSVLITLWIFYNVYRNLKESFQILLQAVPGNKDIMDLRKQINALPDVSEIHDIHLWTLDGEFDIFTIHLKTDTLHTLEEGASLKKEIRKLLISCDINHITIEVEHRREVHESMDC